jgi:hypothetical protein
MPGGGRILVIEMVIPPGNEPHPSKTMDLNMLVLNHYGQERTEAEFRTLFEAAGFHLRRLIPTCSAFSLLEGVPA